MSNLTELQLCSTKDCTGCSVKRNRIAAGDLPALCMSYPPQGYFCTHGVRTARSKMLDNFVLLYNATVVENFHRDGAVMLGKPCG